MHPPSIRPCGRDRNSRLQPGCPRHTADSTYRCFLPDLTGFAGLRCAGPGLHRHLLPLASARARPRVGIQPCYSGLQEKGTATSPPSTTEKPEKPSMFRIVSLLGHPPKNSLHFTPRIQPGPLNSRSDCNTFRPPAPDFFPLTVYALEESTERHTRTLELVAPEHHRPCLGWLNFECSNCSKRGRPLQRFLKDWFITRKGERCKPAAGNMAERLGFEPRVNLRPHTLSRRAP